MTSDEQVILFTFLDFLYFFLFFACFSLLICHAPVYIFPPCAVVFKFYSFFTHYLVVQALNLLPVS